MKQAREMVLGDDVAWFAMTFFEAFKEEKKVRLCKPTQV